MKRLLSFLGLEGMPREIWILALAALVNRAGTMVIPFLVLWTTKERGFAPGRAGLVLLVYGLTSLVTAPFSGRLSDRIGPLRQMRASLFLSGIVFLLYPLAHTPAAIFAVTAALAVVNEAYRPASLAVLSDLSPAERQKSVFALNRLAINLGMSLGPALGGFLAMKSFSALFVIDGLTSILSGFLLVAFLPVHLAVSNRAPKPGVVTRAAHRDPRLLLFLFAFIPVGIVFFQHEGALALFLIRDLGQRESFYGLLFTLNTILIVLFELKLNFATSHWSHARTLSLGAFLMGAGFGAYALAHGTWGIVLGAVIWTFGEMVLLPGSSAYLADIAPAERRGAYMGLYQMTFGLSFAAGPWLGTVVLEQFGPTVLWSGCFVLGLVSTALFARIKDENTV